MRKLSIAAIALTFALPIFAQTDPPSPDPVPEPTPAPETPAPPPPQQPPPDPVPEPTPTPETPAPPPAQQPPPAKQKSPVLKRFFFGGGVGASFGDVDYIEVAPMVGFKVLPRFDVGVQPFYRWADDGRYSPSVETNDYGATLFARVRVIAGFFVEADYQFTSYEYPSVGGGMTRDTYDAFLAGGGYGFGLGGHVGFYVSALYDFSYDDNVINQPYDSPVRVQVGVSVGF